MEACFLHTGVFQSVIHFTLMHAFLFHYQTIRSSSHKHKQERQAAIHTSKRNFFMHDADVMIWWSDNDLRWSADDVMICWWQDSEQWKKSLVTIMNKQGRACVHHKCTHRVEWPATRLWFVPLTGLWQVVAITMHEMRDAWDLRWWDEGCMRSAMRARRRIIREHHQKGLTRAWWIVDDAIILEVLRAAFSSWASAARLVYPQRS